MVTLVARSTLVANDPKRSLRWHGAHAVAIASDPHTLRAVGDELQNETS
jgi:hypothetical protein